MSTRRGMSRTVLIVVVPVVAYLFATAALRELRLDAAYELLLGVAYFVFGLLLAFALENARGRRGRITELLKSGDADLYSTYQLLVVFGAPTQEQFRGLFDAYLQAEIDYSLADYDRSTSAFDELFAAVRSLRPTAEVELVAYDHLLGLAVAKAERRRQVEAVVRQRISPIEWAALIALAGAVWVLIALASSAGGWFVVLGAILVGSLGALLAVLWQLDRLSWQESVAIWQPLHRLFLSLDLVPYYPASVVEKRRISPPSPPYRLAEYPHPYPDMTDKVVRLID